MTVRGTVRADPDRARRRERFPSPNFIGKLAGVSPLVLFRASFKTGIAAIGENEAVITYSDFTKFVGGQRAKSIIVWKIYLG